MGLFFLARVNKKIGIILLLILIPTILVIKLVNKKEKKNINNYRRSLIKSRNKELSNLLKRKNINMLNIKAIIKCLVLELENENIIYRKFPIIDQVLSLLYKLLFIILPILYTIVDKDNKEYNFLNYIILSIIFIIFIIFILEIIKYIFRKDLNLNKIKNLIKELKQIALLNNIDDI